MAVSFRVSSLWWRVISAWFIVTEFAHGFVCAADIQGHRQQGSKPFQLSQACDANTCQISGACVRNAVAPNFMQIRTTRHHGNVASSLNTVQAEVNAMETSWLQRGARLAKGTPLRVLPDVKNRSAGAVLLTQTKQGGVELIRPLASEKSPPQIAHPIDWVRIFGERLYQEVAAAAVSMGSNSTRGFFFVTPSLVSIPSSSNESFTWAKKLLGEAMGDSTTPATKMLSPRVAIVNLRVVLALTFVAYPAVFILGLLLLVAIVSVTIKRRKRIPEVSVGISCETQRDLPNPQDEVDLPNPQEESEDDSDASSVQNLTPLQNASQTQWLFNASVAQNSLLSLDELTDSSKVILYWWALFCRIVPALMVFGIPALLIYCATCWPREVWSIFSIVGCIFTLANAVYIFSHASRSIPAIRKAVQNNPHPVETSHSPGLVHWVILPQYRESVEVVSMTLASIRDGISPSVSIGIVLAMEERELCHEKKAEELQRRFAGAFAEILVTHHPHGLKNDPPGKASNVAWAFRTLEKHLELSGRSQQSIMLTISDSDSEFDKMYFKSLEALYTNSPDGDVCLWQPPIFHLKNYHSQPSPVVVSSVFTTMMELAFAGDPHAMRLPYSTYSLSLALAKRVNGWDPEWIAEDWHMGLKCFLSTYGQAHVRTVPLPIMNYTPEEGTWIGTVQARWTQAKRHALGLSDLSYYLMKLPLLVRAASLKSSSCTEAICASMWMLFRSTGNLIRLMNTHIVLGLLTSFFFIGQGLRALIFFSIEKDGDAHHLIDRAGSFQILVLLFAGACFSLGICMYLKVYDLVKARMEPPKKVKERSGYLTNWWARLFSFNWLFDYWALHMFYLSFCCVIMSVLYFTALGFAVMLASVQIVRTSEFEYEVAGKPDPCIRQEHQGGLDVQPTKQSSPEILNNGSSTGKPSCSAS